MSRRVLYLNCASGISGDMIAGALLDLGADLDRWRRALEAVGLGSVELRAGRISKSGLAATAFRVDLPPGTPRLSSLADVRRRLEGSGLAPSTVHGVLSVFTRLAEAEGRVHGQPPEKVHFHELGSADTMVDALAAVVGLEDLDVGEVLVSPVNVGAGTVRTEHGVFPVPAPATAALLTGFDVFADGEAGEKATPTGAAIAAAFGRKAGRMPRMTVAGVGYGAGQRDFERSVNVLQAVLGSPETEGAEETAVVIECNIDDMNPQVYPYLIRRLLAAGALDAFVVPAVMKKGRPGCLVSVLAPPDKADALGGILMAESTTIGLRRWEVERRKASRRLVAMDTPWGPAAVKIAEAEGFRRAVPEFEDCRRIAEATGRPLLEVMAELGRMAADRYGKED